VPDDDSIGRLTPLRSPILFETTMTTTLRDLMLVCRNGHVITDRLKARPDLRLPRCDRCGADTLDRCETCGTLFGGANPVPFEPVATRRAPSVCIICGATFPWAKHVTTVDESPLERLEQLLRRLPLVARELGRRERSPLTIRDERDLDDLVRALLPVLFDDVRPEARTPSYSPRTRTAFILPAAEAIVVSHLIAPGLNEAEMERRRAVDAELYRTRPECGTLVMFIHDPERRLHQPERLEAVWSREAGKLSVRCVIAA
jgi:hypothetical protein